MFQKFKYFLSILYHMHFSYRLQLADSIFKNFLIFRIIVRK